MSAPAVGGGMALPLPPVASPFLWRQGGRRRPTGGGGESLSPLGRAPPSPVQLNPPTLGPVVAPLRSVGGGGGRE